jgi:hypothetical protein
VKDAGTAIFSEMKFMSLPSTTAVMCPLSSSDLLIRTDVLYMSTNLLGMPYSDLKTLIYPHPSYKSFTIQKRNGAPRLIHEPRQGLKVLQERVLAYLYRNTGPAMPCVHGFTPGRSIVTNAKKHCSQKTQHLLNIDIEDFFPSITFYRVRGLLQQTPFKFSYQVATVLAHLCTFNGTLPQGSPTSPLLANLVCRGLDRDLMNIAKRHRAIYTRYADDITFSFSARRPHGLPANICSFDTGILGQLCNDEPLRQGRHRGKTGKALRDASENELFEARRIACDMILAYLHYLKIKNESQDSRLKPVIEDLDSKARAD